MECVPPLRPDSLLLCSIRPKASLPLAILIRNCCRVCPSDSSRRVSSSEGSVSLLCHVRVCENGAFEGAAPSSYCTASPPWSFSSIDVPNLLLRSAYCSNTAMSSPTGAPPPIPTLQLSTAVTATDHGQIVVLIAWLCFTAGILLSLVRVYIRWPLSALAGKDDATYAVSALFAIIQTAITINAVSKGFGRTESELDGTQVVNAAKVSGSPSVL